MKSGALPNGARHGTPGFRPEQPGAAVVLASEFSASLMGGSGFLAGALIGILYFLFPLLPGPANMVGVLV